MQKNFKSRSIINTVNSKVVLKIYDQQRYEVSFIPLCPAKNYVYC